MAINFDAETAYMLQDTGVAVTLGATSTYGQIDIADEAMLAEMGVYGVKRTLLVKTGALSGVVQDASITVDGTGYKIVGHQRLDEGGVTRILLGNA